jgi:drug/metabolite transporter (DMT)-like permease
MVSVIATLPLALIDLQSSTIDQYAYLIGTGLFAAGGQFGLTYAYKYAKAGEVAVYNYTHIIFSAIIGFIIWNEISDIYSISGGVIIIVVSLVIYLYNRKYQ